MADSRSRKSRFKEHLDSGIEGVPGDKSWIGKGIHRVADSIGLNPDNLSHVKRRGRSYSDSGHQHSHNRTNWHRPYSLSPTPYRRQSGSSSFGKNSAEENEWANAVEAAIGAAAVEAFRLRKEPGPWVGRKGVRVATAALSAAAIDTVIDQNREQHSTRKVMGSTIGGLMTNRLVNGPRRDLR